MKKHLTKGRLIGIALLVFSALVLPACGSSGSNSTSGSTEASGETTGGEEAPAETTGSEKPEGDTSSAKYSGVDTKLPTSFPAPEKKIGKPFTVGYLQIYGTISQLALEQECAEKEIVKLGGKAIGQDANLELSKQTEQFEQMLAKGVDAIMVYPIVPQSLGPQLKKAEAAGIPVIATNANSDPSKTFPPGYSADVEQSLDQEAFEQAQTIAKEEPGGSVVIVSEGVAVEALQYLATRQQYWAEKLGLELLGEVPSKVDTPAGYNEAATATLGKYPDAKNILTFNDFTAVSLATAYRNAGKSEVRIIGGQGGVQVAFEAIKAGALFGAYKAAWCQTGKQMAIGAYNSLTGEKQPKKITIPGQVVTAENVESIKAVEEEKE